jgi:hypothetical protein
MPHFNLATPFRGWRPRFRHRCANYGECQTPYLFG